jgi:hypothetical protein
MGDWQRMMESAILAEITARIAAARAGIGDEELARLWEARRAELAAVMRDAL